MADARPDKFRRTPDSGVTLIEVLVVLALIGVSAGVISYSLPSAPRERTVHQEASLFAARINLAAERSLIGGQHYKVVWRTEGYHFEQWQDRSWKSAQGAPLSEAYVLDRGAVLSDPNGAQRGSIRITPDLLPPSEGLKVLQMDAGIIQRSISFDGAAATVEQASP